jgi:hypothetical protein
MTVRKPLVQIAGVLSELPSADSISIGSSAMPDNVLTANTTVPVNKSLVVASYLNLATFDLQVDGNLLIVG